MAENGDLDLRALPERLAASRRDGVAFEWAWRNACAALVPEEPDSTSAAALRATRAAWADAYERRPPQGQQRGVAGLAAVYYEPPAGRDRLLG